MTPDTALRLAQVTGMSADFWLGLQLDWDVWHALRSKDAERIGHLEPLAAARVAVAHQRRCPGYWRERMPR